MILTLFLNISLNDYPLPYQMGFQDPATPTMESIIDFHHDLMFYLLLVVQVVLWLLVKAIFEFSYKTPTHIYPGHLVALKWFYLPSRTYNNMYYELGWTFIPTIFILSLLAPSFALLYAMEEIVHPALVVKVIGRQWYWDYEYAMSNKHWGKKGSVLREVLEKYNPRGNTRVLTHYRFSSRMVAEDDLKPGMLRLLTVDNRLHIPTKATVKFLVTSADVIHSWAVPSLGVKVDACPGRLNQIFVYVKRPGVFYGQCSELCGVNHYAMPIVVKAEPYLYWLHYHYCMRVRMIFWLVFNITVPADKRFYPVAPQKFYRYSLAKRVKHYWWGST